MIAMNESVVNSTNFHACTKIKSFIPWTVAYMSETCVFVCLNMFVLLEKIYKYVDLQLLLCISSDFLLLQWPIFVHFELYLFSFTDSMTTIFSCISFS